ncbi:MAG: PQQ-binding-like beta-propeller repeat protein [Planctomycetes bacterium]|nr:PQQ-binding-like beta-propeller repeat protein [Planctomycetota bacterium]
MKRSVLLALCLLALDTAPGPVDRAAGGGAPLGGAAPCQGRVAAPTPDAPQDPQEEQIFTEEVDKNFVDKLLKARQAGDWRAFFARVDEALRRFSQKLIADPERPQTRISFVEYLLRCYSTLPPEALDHFRAENDARARAALDQAIEEGSPTRIQKTVWAYFLASDTDATLDRLAGGYFDARMFGAAILYWNWLLRYYPDSEIPKTVTAARIAVACRAAGSRSVLLQLRAYLRKTGLDGTVVVGREKVRLSAFVEGITIDAGDEVLTAGTKLPSVPEPDNRLQRRLLGVRNDIRRWVYDYSLDKGESSAKPDPENRTAKVRIIRRGWDESGVAQGPDFPFLPAYARIGEAEYVVATNGLRVIAFNPGAVRGEGFSTGVYWKYPENGPIPHPPMSSSYSGYFSFSLPYVGVTIRGEHAFATLYSERTKREVNPQTMDLFDAPTRLACFHIPSGRIVWDTDTMEALLRPYEFPDRNYAFCSPPIVRGTCLYVGVCTSPMGEEESRVLCLDAATGRPLWCTNISSVTGGGRNMMFGGGQRIPAHLTLLAEDGGVVYVESSLGTVAAVDGATGIVLWLATYKRTARRPNYNQQEPLTIRPPNAPLVHRGTMYVLPQDADDLMAFDTITGARLELPTAKVQDRDLQWKVVTHLVGIVRDWMVLGGSETYVVRMKDFKAYGLPFVNASRCGLGTLVGETAYFPAYTDAGGELAIYHGAGSWKQLAQTKWKGKEEYGNLLVAGDFLIVATNRILVYTDTERVRQEYAARIGQSPPHLETLLEYGTVMRENDKLEYAAEALLEFARGAEGDPRYEAKVRQVRVELYDIFSRRGDEAAKSADPDGPRKALALYRMARDFSYDPATYAESTRKIARTHETLRQWREAVAEYENLIRRGRDLTYRSEGSNMVETFWTHARRKIAEILAQQSEAYEEIEKEAGEALRKIADGDVEALKALRELYPNSKAAREAWLRLYEHYLKKGVWDKVRALLEEFKSWYGAESGFEHQKRVIELLDRIGDAERLVCELERLRERFGTERMGGDGEAEPVADYVERRLRDLARRPRPDQSPVHEPLGKIGEMDAASAAPSADALAIGYVPLRPRGIVPPDFPGAWELFRNGSAVELWDLRLKRRMWSCPHPGGYLGIRYQEPKDLGARGVVVVEIRAGSPAERAGLKKDDVVLEVQGSSVTVTTWQQAVRDAAPGAKLGLRVLRGGQVLDATCDVEAWPREMRPAVVGASFTRDYELAVAWEDGVASVETATGRVRWFFAGVRDPFVAEALHAVDGRLFLYEAFRPGRTCRPLRVLPPPAEGRPALDAAEAHHRLVCIDDFSGRVEWIRAFDVVNPSGQGGCGLLFHAPYLADRIAVIETGQRGSISDWILTALNVSDGQPAASGPRSVSMGAAVLARAVSPAGDVLYYVDGRDASSRTLRSVRLGTAAGPKTLDVALVPKYIDPGSSWCRLVADARRVCLVSAGPSAESYKITVFGAADGKEIRALTLPEDRALPPGGSGEPELADGVLYVYNVLKVAPKTGGGPPGFLTAFRLDDGAVLWDAVAPSLPSGGGGYRVETGMKEMIVFAADLGAAPRENPQAPVAAVYSIRDGGYLRVLFTDLTPLPGIDPVVFRRGRLYVNARSGLQIYGNAE